MEKTTIYEKLLEAQKEIGAIKKDSDNPYFKSKYVDINGILAVVKPVLNKHGLVLTQALNVIEGHIALNTAITDSTSGEKIESNCYLPEMPDPQKTGSAITYFRRYSLQTLLALEAEDDDGNVASGKIKKPENKNVEEFMKDLEPTDEEIIQWQELLESSQTAKEARENWKKIPPMVQAKLEKVKEQVKAKLNE